MNAESGAVKLDAGESLRGFVKLEDRMHAGCRGLDCERDNRSLYVEERGTALGIVGRRLKTRTLGFDLRRVGKAAGPFQQAGDPRSSWLCAQA